MFGLRKRAKLIQEEKVQSSTIDFNNLPIEIYYCIFDYLKMSDVLNLRLLNSFFKHLIDNSKFIWKKNSIKIDFGSKIDLEKVADFTKRVKICHLKAYCFATLTKKQLRLQKSLRFDSEQSYDLKIKKLNIFSINCLNFFPNCSCLQIESFISTNGSVIGQKVQDNSSIELEPFGKTHSFDVSCLVYDSKSEKQFLWDSIMRENCLLNKINHLFPNLVDLSIHFYNGCLYKLLKKISKLNQLKSLELDTLKQMEVIALEKLVKVKNRLNLAQIKVKMCSLSVVFNLIKIIDVNKCKKLVLIVPDGCLVENEMENEYFVRVVQILPELRNLHDLETNLYHLENGCALNFHVLGRDFFFNLKKLALIDDGSSKQILGIERFSQIFLNNKYYFKNLQSVRIKLVTDCRLKCVLPALLDFFVKNAPSLEIFEFQLNCICLKCRIKKLCSFYTKSFDQFVNGYFCFKFNIKYDENRIKKLLSYFFLI